VHDQEKFKTQMLAMVFHNMQIECVVVANQGAKTQKSTHGCRNRIFDGFNFHCA
jgi:hypothetical protein